LFPRSQLATKPTTGYLGGAPARGCPSAPWLPASGALASTPFEGPAEARPRAEQERSSKRDGDWDGGEEGGG
jgi:hypothetical protein